MICQELTRTCGPDIYETPAPVLNGIGISDMAGNRHPRLWPGLIDTGADRTVIPLEICEDLGLSPREWRRPESFDRESDPRSTPLYYVRTHVDGLGDVSLLSYGVARQNVLLGRDFLCGLVLLVDNHTFGWQLGHHSIWSRLVVRFLGLR